ncbi:MAG: hypothetical protein LC099_08740 [Anaerolineales bacterium]|nr:hypothetical protein [Anaerolineales bacterium]
MKPFQILLIISFLLTACAPRTTAASAPPAQATVASTPLSTETPPVESTKIVPTPTEKAKTIEELAADILAGEPVDSSALTPEQQAALDAALAEHAGEIAQQFLDNPQNFSMAGLPEGTVNLVREKIAELVNAKAQEVTFNGAAYLSNDLEMRKLEDDSTPEQRKFITFYKVRQDEADNWYYTDYNGDEYLITNFDGVPKEPVTDVNSDAIKWTGDIYSEGTFTGLTRTQAYLQGSINRETQTDLSESDKYNLKGAYTEAVVLRPVITQAFFDTGRERPSSYSVVEIGVPMYSADGVLLGLQRMAVIPWNKYLLLYAEGEDWEMPIGGNANTEHEFKDVEGNQAIWLFTYGVANPFLSEQNKDDWQNMDIHTQAVLDLLRKGSLLTEDLALAEAAVMILQKK